MLVGDPGRVHEVSKFFDTIEFKTAHREFITHTGFIGAKRLTVISTGIGTDNIDITMNELDAAVNIDPVTRTIRPQLRKLNIYRLGTSGAIQPDLPVNQLVISSFALGLDGLLNYYDGLQRIMRKDISEAFISQLNWPSHLPFPYCVAGSHMLQEKFDASFYRGITATAPGFYAPQGREIRLKAVLPAFNQRLSEFRYDNYLISNWEMETSALYGLGKLLGHECLTICVIIANRASKEFTINYKESIDILITRFLEKLKASK